MLADFTHTRVCKPFCEKYLTLPAGAVGVSVLLHLLLPGCNRAGIDGAVRPQELPAVFPELWRRILGCLGRDLWIAVGRGRIVRFRASKESLRQHRRIFHSFQVCLPYCKQLFKIYRNTRYSLSRSSCGRYLRRTFSAASMAASPPFSSKIACSFWASVRRAFSRSAAWRFRNALLIACTSAAF